MEQIPILFTNQSFSVCSTVHVLLKVKKNFQKFHCIANKGQFLKKNSQEKETPKYAGNSKFYKILFVRLVLCILNEKKSFDIS